MSIEYSKNRAINSIGQGALTNSKHWNRFVYGVYPTHISHGRDCFLFDTEGKKYIDFICGLGTNLYGYANPAITDEVIKYSYHGSCHSLPSVFELEAAESVKSIFYFADKVKFVNDGSSGCSAALLMARTYTGRDIVLSSGYHGWHNEYVGLTDPANGVCENMKGAIKKYTGISHINDPKKIAAIIIEPVELDDSKERINELKHLREFCTDNGICLIFDEVITGMRYKKLAVSLMYDIKPDIIILSKAIANGEKIGVVAGRKEILDGPYFCSGTFHGHVGSLVALSRTLHLAAHNNYDVTDLNDRTKHFLDKFNELVTPHFRIDGWGARGAFRGDQVIIAKFWQEMCKAGFLFGPSFFSNYHLIDQFDKTLNATNLIINKGWNNIVLEGPLPSSPFSTKMRKDN